MSVTVCVSRVVGAGIRYMDCPTCARRRRMWAELHAWYGWLVTCLTCGERWNDGERMHRPFKPRWRAESVEQAKRRMRELGKVKLSAAELEEAIFGRASEGGR